MVNSAASKIEQQTPAMVQRLFFWLTSGFVALAIMVILVGTHHLQKPESLPIRVIQINGEFKHITAEAIEREVTSVLKGGFFNLDMHRVRDAVLAMPWVEDVSVRRIWPDTLAMNVTEQVALARWGDNGFVNVTGGVFEPHQNVSLEGLVALDGPEGSSSRVVDFYQQVRTASKTVGLNVSKMYLDERRDWRVTYDSGLQLALGKQAVAKRLNEFIRVYPRLSAMPDKSAQRIDMRYEHGFAVKWHPTVETVAEQLDKASKPIKLAGGGSL